MEQVTGYSVGANNNNNDNNSTYNLYICMCIDLPFLLNQSLTSLLEENHTVYERKMSKCKRQEEDTKIISPWVSVNSRLQRMLLSLQIVFIFEYTSRTQFTPLLECGIYQFNYEKAESVSTSDKDSVCSVKSTRWYTIVSSMLLSIVSFRQIGLALHIQVSFWYYSKTSTQSVHRVAHVYVEY